MRVLVTDGDERSALAVTRALGQQQIQVLVGAEGLRSLAAMSRYSCGSFSYPSPFTDADGFISEVLDRVKKNKIGVVFPVSDIAMQLIGQHREEFEKYAVVPMPPIKVFERYSNKDHLVHQSSNL